MVSKNRSSRLGFVAMVVAISIAVLSVVTSIVTSAVWGSYAIRVGSGWSYPLSITSSNEALVAVLVTLRFQFFLGSGVGIWALTQGIVAVAQKRGRPFGVAALVVAVVAPITSAAAALASFYLALPK